VSDKVKHKAGRGAGCEAQGRKGCRIRRCTRQKGVSDKEMHKAGGVPDKMHKAGRVLDKEMQR